MIETQPKSVHNGTPLGAGGRDLEIYGDVAVSSKNSAFIVAMGWNDYPTIRSPYPGPGGEYVSISGNEPWSPWGDNNLLPYDIADDLLNCGVLSAGVDAKARIGTGKGLQPFFVNNVSSDGKEDLEWISDTDVLNFLEENETFEFAFDSAYDRQGYGWNCGAYGLNRKKDKILRLKRYDVFEARLEKKNKTSKRIENLYLSAKWNEASWTDPTKRPERIPLLVEGDELNDLNTRVSSAPNQLEYAFAKRTLRNGQHYYPIPLYRSNRAWIKIARSVPASKIAMFKNQITLKYLVTIHPKFWDDKYGQTVWHKYTLEEKKKYVDEYYTKIDTWLSGEDNGYKSLFTGGFNEPGTAKFTPYVTVETIDDKIKDGKYLPDSGAANSEILFSLMINPALMGAGNPGGNAYGDTSGGSNVRESFLVQLMIMEPERRAVASIMDVVKKFNGWSKRLEVEKTVTTAFTDSNGNTTTTSRIVKPRMVFRYLSGLLTTLDTGKSTKPEAL